MIFISALILSLFIPAVSLHGAETESFHRSIPAGAEKITVYKTDESGNPLPRAEYRYCREGFPEKEIIFSSRGVIKWIILYNYGDAGLKSSREAFTEDGSPLWKVSYAYNSEGALIRETHTGSDGEPDYMTVYEYQEDTTEAVSYGHDGSLHMRKKIIDDEQRNTSETYYYYPDGTRIKGIIREYDDYMRLQLETHTDEIGALFRRIEHKYDKSGRLKERTAYNYRGEVSRKTSLRYTSGGYLQSLRRVTKPENQVEEHTYSYKKDSRGAWIFKRKTIRIIEENRSGQTVEVTDTLREIEYYRINES